MAGVRESLPSALFLVLLLFLPGTTVAQVGFVSLNCGADSSGGFTDPQTGIRWVSDQTYISTGSSGVVSSTTLSTEMMSLRYFPQYRKNCYNITVQPTFIYLIRAGFYYGNYDGKGSRTITFSLSLDNTPWETVDLTYDAARPGSPTYIEAFTANATSNNLVVCLIREGTDVPFINSLEARLIDQNGVYTKSSSFPNEQVHMHLRGRANFGEKTRTIRFPEDKWDRFWPSYLDEFPELAFIDAISAPPNVTIINNENSSRDQPPSAVMATAIQGPVITYSRAFAPPARLIAIQYYAEFNASLTPLDRRFIKWQSNLAAMPYVINITTAVPVYNTLEILFTVPNEISLSALTFTLEREPDRSTMDPILNADELYTVHTVVLDGTNQNDVDALWGIKTDLDLVQWVGDPCLPVSWNEVTCTPGVSGVGAKITGLDLSKQGLSGPLPPTVAGLAGLETLLLSNNNFSGPLLDTFSGLVALKTLNVANNGLSGPLPNWLAMLPQLTELDVSGNSFSGSVPEALLANPRLNFSYTGNQLVCTTPSCPPSPPPPPAPAPRDIPFPPPPEKKKKSSLVVIVAAVIGGIAILAIIAIVIVGVCCCYNRKSALSSTSAGAILPRGTPTSSERSRASPPSAPPPLPPQPIAVPIPEVWEPSPVWSPAASSGRTVSSSTPIPMGFKGKAKQFSLADIKTATTDFRKQIGAGSFGPVFYGRLPTDENQPHEEVAVKVLSSTSVQGEKEFITEIEFLSMLHHKNLVHIVGYCQQGSERILIYEHMSGGDLGSRLHGPVASKSPISWRDRLQIALDAAQGLEYLHHGCKPAIIHRDVKSSNILLSKTNEAKVSDFGLSKIMGQGGDLKGDTTIIKAGTVGHEYIDPEYFRTSYVTTESDVYSFGVILLELITGRSPIATRNPGHPGHPKPLVEWVHSLVKKADLKAMADPLLAEMYDHAALWGLIEIAVRCTDASRSNRPSMAEVVKDLSRLVKSTKR